MARAGNPGPLWDALEQYRARLNRLVALRMHPRARGRIDASDVVQEALLEVSQRLDHFLAQGEMPFFLWVRYLTVQKLQQLHRFHLGAEARDARREVLANVNLGPAASSLVLARSLAASGLSPSQHVAEAERFERLERVLEGLDAVDLEVIALRHFEELSNREAAQVLGLKESAASRRYLRAVVRIREQLESEPK
ncbi:MAG: sigma-70 family RNA polymerase sigma factor [Planctomycetota bacterium]